MSQQLSSQQQTVLDQLLLEAVGARDIEHVKLYVEKGANVNMSAGVLYENLSRNGSTVSFNREAPLFHYLYTKGGLNRDIADYLIEQGVDIDTRDQMGNTVLMLAAKQGDVGSVKYLVAKGADPMAQNNRSEIVLEEARGLQNYYHSNRQQIIDALVGAMPTVNKSDKPQRAEPEIVELPKSPPQTPLQKRINNHFNP